MCGGVANDSGVGYPCAVQSCAIGDTSGDRPGDLATGYGDGAGIRVTACMGLQCAEGYCFERSLDTGLGDAPGLGEMGTDVQVDVVHVERC